METVDLLIKNGRVIDPDNNVDDVIDVAVKDKRIYKVGKDLNVTAAEEFDADGCLVTPGLIDAHVHCYEYATPLGINPDATCLSRGVTTIIDCGSAGASTFPGLRKYIVEKSKTRVKCLLHIALHGLAASGCARGAPGGESDTLAVLDEGACVKCIEANRDVIIGVKVRLSASVCAGGKTEIEAFRRALSVAQTCGLPLMAHHSISTIPVQKSEECTMSCPGNLRPGDIYTHMYHAQPPTILDEKTRVLHGDVMTAKSRGILFDVGHGAGGFNWTIAELATKQGLWPDFLGTDLHTVTVNGPGYDMPTVMTKFLHLGMSLPEIVKAVTSAPARAYGLDDTIGSLTPGKEADITVLRIDACDVMLEDTQGQCRRVTQRIVPVAVWRAGQGHPVGLSSPWPNPAAKLQGLDSWDEVPIKDDVKPSM